MQPQTQIVALCLVCVILEIGWLPPPCIDAAQPQRPAGASGGAGSFTGEDLPCNAGDWPCWHGPRRNNHSADREPPTHWSRESRIAWKSEISGRGHASPCVFGDRIFIASADEETETQFLVCYERTDGQQVWRTDLHHGHFPPKNGKNSHASGTPACDGRLVIVPFVNADKLSVSAVDLDGYVAWPVSVGEYSHANGYGASPVLFHDLVILASDNTAEPLLVALNRMTGDVVWRTARRSSDNSATPIVAHVAGRWQLLINGAYRVSSYDPATGELWWWVDHQTEVAACTMAFDELFVYASGNVPEKNMLCVRADGHGDVTDTHVHWKTRKSNTYVPSPLICDDLLFVVIDSGVAFCRDAHSGDVIWKQRLGGDFSASPVLAGGNVYAISEDGATHVFRAGRKFELVAKNDLGERCLATPAICGGSIFIRTEGHLYCIGNEAP